MKLEELARQSADAARASVVHLDPPPIGERRARSPWRLPALVGIAALTLVAVVGSVVWIGGDGDEAGDGGETVMSGGRDVPRLALPAELSAYRLVRATAFSELRPEDFPAPPRFEYYGTPGAEDPYADGDLLVMTLVGQTADEELGDDAGTVSVRGTSGYVTPELGMPGDVTLIQWFETGPGGAEMELLVGSRTRSVDELVAIADELRVETPEASDQHPSVTVPERLGLERIASATGVPFQGFDPALAGTEGSLVGYEQPTTDATLVLISRAGQLGDELPGLLFWALTVEEITVNGRPGLDATFRLPSIDLPTTLRTISWAPAEGLVASLTQSGPDSSIDLVALAESVRELDDATWEQYRSGAASSIPREPDLDEVYGAGDGDVGSVDYSWTLGVRGEDLCITLFTGGRSTGSCMVLDHVEVAPEPARLVHRGVGNQLSDVLIAAAPFVEVVVETTGAGVTERVDGGGLRWFVWVGAPEDEPRFDVVVDGEVIDQLDGEAVEEIDLAEPAFDIAGHAPAQAMGITEGFELLMTGTEETITWALGRSGSDLCLLTEGEAVTASCLPENDLMVFRPPGLTEGEDTSHVLVQNVPACLELGGIDQLTTAGSTSSFEPDSSYELLVVPGLAQGWRLSLLARNGAEVLVDLPDIEGSESWPELLCDG